MTKPSVPDPRRDLTPDQRAEFCRQVLERFSELVDGEAPEDFCARVEEVLGDCPSFVAFRNTFAVTLREIHACRDDAAAVVDEERFRACVEQVRQRL